MSPTNITAWLRLAGCECSAPVVVMPLVASAVFILTCHIPSSKSAAALHTSNVAGVSSNSFSAAIMAVLSSLAVTILRVSPWMTTSAAWQLVAAYGPGPEHLLTYMTNQQQPCTHHSVCLKCTDRSANLGALFRQCPNCAVGRVYLRRIYLL